MSVVNRKVSLIQTQMNALKLSHLCAFVMFTRNLLSFNVHLNIFDKKWIDGFNQVHDKTKQGLNIKANCQFLAFD